MVLLRIQQIRSNFKFKSAVTPGKERALSSGKLYFTLQVLLCLAPLRLAIWKHQMHQMHQLLHQVPVGTPLATCRCQCQQLLPRLAMTCRPNMNSFGHPSPSVNYLTESLSM